jgi:protein-S-isoprenylcysteine O-methyltransferase Ste14
VPLYRLRALFSWNPVVITLQVLGFLIMLWARITFGLRSFHFSAKPTNGPLITHGPYRFVRNPIYAAALLFMWAGISAHLSFTSVALGLCVVAAFALRIAGEEALLRKQFPDYPAYAKRTARLIPFLLRIAQSFVVLFSGPRMLSSHHRASLRPLRGCLSK